MSTAPSSPSGAPYTVVGRYAIFDEIASGGMATVHLGRLLGAAGFSRTVAIKRLHPQLARDQEFCTMFVDEALLASRINHPNVVQTIDVVPEGKELLLVMEYVHGVPFAQLLGTVRRAGGRVPVRVVAGVMVGVLEGLHAAHEARSEAGLPLGVVHRDVSPQNVLVSVEGVPRVIDFGVAKAMGKMHATRDGQLKGKLSYMSPEQVRGAEVTRLSDIFSAAIVLWEALMSERLFDGKNPAELIMQVLSHPIQPPRSKFPDLPEELEAVVMKGLSRDPAERFATAREMAVALESAAGGVAPAREIAEWVESMANPALAQRAKLLESIERALSAPPTSSERARIEGLLKASVPPAANKASVPPAANKASVPPAADKAGEPSTGSGPHAKPAPIPIPGALSADEQSDLPGVDTTMPSKGRSLPPPSKEETSSPGKDSAPRPLPIVAAPIVAAPTASPVAAPLDIGLMLRSPAEPDHDGAARGPIPRAPAEPDRDAATRGPIPRAPAEAGHDEAARGPLPRAPAEPLPNSLEPAAGAPRPRDASRPYRRPIQVTGGDTDEDHSGLKERLAWPIRLVLAGVVVSLADFALRQFIVLPIKPIWFAEVLVVVGVIWAFVGVFLPARGEE
ncbi:MAG: protein kinase [Minicystis sp.]